MSDTIRISGGTINGDVLNFGERTYYQGGEIKGDIRGGRNTNYLFITSGTDGLKARNVYGFSNISFNLPSSVTDGYTALNLTGTAQTNLDNTRIYAQLKDATGLTKDSKIHLIKTAGSIINFDETKTNAVLTNVNIANLVNIAGKIVLSDEKTLDLTFIGNPIPSGWSYTDQIYNIISKTEFTRNTTDGIKTFNIVSNFDNGEMTEQSNNTINMNFGDVSTNARIYGGFGDNDSTNNTINISVNSFSGNNIYGGYSTNGNATNNTINFIKGDLKVAVSLYGGFSGDSSKDMLSGNTLNIGTASTPTAMNLRARHIENFETINFYLPSSVTNDSVALNLYDSGETDLSKSTINAYLQNASNLTADSKIHLIQTAGTLNVKDEYKTADGVEQAGVKNINIANLVNVKGYIKLSDEKNLDLVFKGDEDTSGSGSGGSTGGGSTGGGSTGGGSTGGGSGTGGGSTGGSSTGSNTGGRTSISANENSKTLLETKLSQSIAINESGNLFLSNLNNIVSTTLDNTNTSDTVVFAYANGSDKRYKTGSHVDQKGFNVNVGIASTDRLQSGDFTTGAFIEYGKGEYESKLDNGLLGKGDTELIGGGVFAKYQNLSNYYIDGSFRVGSVKTEYEKSLYDEFDISSTYYGAHIGVGKIFDLTDSNNLDIYSRFIYSYTEGSELNIKGVDVSLDSVTSKRAQIGLRDTIRFNDTNSFYVGAAYQYEFDAKSSGELSLPTFGFASIASPSLKGSTGIGEIGYTYETNSFKFDISAKGYVGKEEGYSGNMGVSFKF
ncbi:autotransporter outer membrane beta-barrel domain-containing protein [Campylobacter sp. JMF_02 ED1]|uniref:autotransporter outer membrane beta-barrel domain-containing protein n=1 Tax=Campylobacter sp. JMF_02 ED1 TaxID=2983826 RepID=UPI0022E9B3E8|nr:autotransporter outer membrane beta-barrel domain-containing protein [Campylobacter sp. JMF_02 ED1]MDA3051672.1 autotransporter outer membrane beta-barrel domain-containing protein [Campylobacter sp. JMF_02 ED1]